MNAMQKLLEWLREKLSTEDYTSMYEKYYRDAAQDSRESRARNKKRQEDMKKKRDGEE